ncbi:MAG: NmrA family NAD(P)-binding protein [Alphaproteobacteria bacterium]|nr:NmrA family NAD(P)-binding protein [Alphaproteobacteria bacterium]
MIFISGAAGHLGRAVINHLLATFKVPASEIIAGTRDAAKLADLKAKGVTIRHADFDDEAGLAKSLAGVDRFLLISTDAMAPGARARQHAAAVKAAKAAGVAHIVYTSMPRPETSAVLFAPDHAGTEKAIKDAGFKASTILRDNWYFENLFHSMPIALKSGTHYSAAGQGKMAHIARDDQARAIAAVLAKNAPGHAVYTLSGAKAYTIEEVAALVSKATGKPLNVVHVPVEGLVQGMIGAGLPEAVARIFASFDDNIAKGGLEGDAKDYKSITGQEPQPFEDWVKANAAALAG